MILVYKYGLLPPVEGGELVRTQLLAAHRYRNALVEIERWRRERLRVVERAAGDIPALEEAVKQAEGELGAAVLAIKAERKETRSRSESEALREAVKAARQTHRTARLGLTEARKKARLDPEIERQRDEVNEEAKEKRRRARDATEAYWGTYLLIEAADEQARKMPLYDGTRANDPRFMRFTGEGSVSVQVQKGHPAEDIFEMSTRLNRLVRIEPVKEEAWNAPRRGDRIRASRTRLHLRVGSDEKKRPIWAVWPMIMHRRLPEGAIVKRVNVSVRRHGPREEWTTEFTIEVPDVIAPKGERALAIDLGWRKIGDELRVAVWFDTAGEQGEVRLPARLLGALAKATELQGLRDDLFNRIRARTEAWIKANELPEALVEPAKTIALWRSQARLVSLWRRWSKARFDGDEEIFEALSAWRKTDLHLWSWQSGARRAALRQRREIYRIEAARIVRQYDVAVLEEFDLRRMAQRAPTEQEKAENEHARHNRQLAALSEFRSAITNAMSRAGKETAAVDAAYTTRACHVCGVVETFDAGALVMHGCAHCKAIWDQDLNASVNLLERWRARPKPEGARDTKNQNDSGAEPTSKWTKAKLRAKEKADRARTARKADPSSLKSEEIQETC